MGWVAKCFVNCRKGNKIKPNHRNEWRKVYQNNWCETCVGFLAEIAGEKADLQGRRVATLTAGANAAAVLPKGIYVVRGKKIVVK